MTDLLMETEVDTQQITLEQDDLLSAVSALAKFVPSKPQNDSLNGVWLGYNEDAGTLTLRTTNGVTAAEVVLDSVGYDGPLITEDYVSFLVPARIFLGIISAYPSGSISLELDGQVVYVVSGKLRYKVNTLDDAGWPVFAFAPEDQLDALTAVDASSVLSSLSFAAKASAKGSDKPNLHGVRVSTDANGVTSFFATDTKHMLEKRITLGGGFEAKAFTLPAEALEAMNAMISPSDRIKILTHDNGYWIQREDGSVKISVRGFAQKYPDMAPVLNLAQDKAFVVSREDLVDTFKRMRAFVDKGNQKITMKFSGMFVEIGIASSDGEASEMLNISPYVLNAGESNEYTFEEIPEDWELGFRLTWLSDALSSFSSDEIAIRATALNRPVLFHAPDSIGTRYITSLIK
mgnify:CR=1 FL=1